MVGPRGHRPRLRVSDHGVSPGLLAVSGPRPPCALTQGFPGRSIGGPQISLSAWLRAGGWGWSGSRREPQPPGGGVSFLRTGVRAPPVRPAAQGCTRPAPTNLQIARSRGASVAQGRERVRAWPRPSAVEGAGTPSAVLPWQPLLVGYGLFNVGGCRPAQAPSPPDDPAVPGLSWVWNWASPCTQAHCIRLTGTGLPRVC